MSAFLGELLQAMSAEREACTRLVELAKVKKEQLIGNRVSEINLTVRSEAEAVKKLKAAAKHRVEAVKAIALEHGIAGEIDFARTIALLPADKRAAVENFKEDFAKTIEELASLNELNQRLIETQIQYTEFCLSMVTGSSSGLDTYANTGHVREEAPALKSLIDTKA